MISSFDRGTTHTNEKWYLRLIPFIYKPRAGLTSLDSLVIKTKILTIFFLDGWDMQLEKEIMPWRNIEPLCGYLSFSWRVFLQIVGISTKSSHIKNCLRYNPNNHDGDDGKKN